MRAEEIYDGITDIRDDLIDSAKSAPKRRRRYKWWFSAAAAMLVLAIVGGILFRPGGGLTAYAVSEAEYPEMAHYPGLFYTQKAHDAWWDDVRAQSRELGDISSLKEFFKDSTGVFLSDTEGQNMVYSPLNVYMALAMLAQITDGESRSQILTLLGSDSMDSLRSQASDVWNSNYRDDGAVTSILANSVWLSDDISYNRDTVDTLANDFYASSYQGKMGSDAYDKALREWLNRQTGNLLKKQAENVGMDADTIVALAATVYFRAKWSDEFSKSRTSPQTFHSPAGDIETDFMHQQGEQNYYWGSKFAAVCQYFKQGQGGAMWFILPDEGITPEELLADSETMEFIFDRDEWANCKYLKVNKAIPKFDVVSQFDLKDGLQKMGVTDVFDRSHADFAPFTSDADTPVFVSQTSHAARVMIDEEGCVATAFTEFPGAGAAEPPSEEVDFVLDRPFIFYITGDSGLPMFVGVVNVPTGV